MSVSDIPPIQQSPSHNLLLLTDEPDPLPKWMSYYRIVSYIWFTIHIIYSIFHLCFITFILAEQLLHIQFQPVYSFLEYNSYSVLCPLLGILFVGILIYHVRRKVKLDDGDFFGFIGVLLFLCLIMSYDATGIWHLYTERTQFLNKKLYENMQEDLSESNELSWQFAWSTKPTCARVHARLNHEKNERERKEAEKNAPVEGPKILNPYADPDAVNSWMYAGLTKDQLEQGFLSDPFDDRTADEITYKDECGESPNSQNPIDEPRDWMIIMQKQFECCGPYGREHWKTKVTDLQSCKGDVGCAQSFNQYLRDFFLAALLIMYVEVVVYLVTIIVACFHYAAMKYDETRVVKEYSLLNIHEERVTVIDIEEEADHYPNRRLSIDPRSDPRARAAFDPYQEIFDKANQKAQKTRTSDLGFPTALAPSHSPHHAHSGHSGGHPHHGRRHSRPTLALVKRPPTRGSNSKT